MEVLDEIEGSGDIYDYGFRMYDPRLGRFLSVDPLTKSYPHLTPYQFAGNIPIMGSDLDGLEFDIRIYSPITTVNVIAAFQAEDLNTLLDKILWAVKTPFPKEGHDWYKRTYNINPPNSLANGVMTAK